MKKLLYSVLLLSVAAVASAEKGPKPHEGKGDPRKDQPKEVTCAVMTGNKVNIKDAMGKKMFADHKGRRYFFCCAGCPDAFKKNPDKYAKSASIPAPKPEKKAK